MAFAKSGSIQRFSRLSYFKSKPVVRLVTIATTASKKSKGNSDVPQKLSYSFPVLRNRYHPPAPPPNHEPFHQQCHSRIDLGG